MLKFINILRQAFFKSIDKKFFSQFGEDRIVNEIFEINYANGFYVDVVVFIQLNIRILFDSVKKAGLVLI